MSAFENISDEQWAQLSELQQREIIKREASMFFHQCDFVNAGLAIRWGGLVWFLPLYHDAYGENI